MRSGVPGKGVGLRVPVEFESISLISSLFPHLLRSRTYQEKRKMMRPHRRSPVSSVGMAVIPKDSKTTVR